MKTMKKSGLIAVALAAVALITTVAFVMGCRPEADSGLQLPDGYVQMSFNSKIARTVLPDTATIKTFTSIRLDFSSSVGDETIWIDPQMVVGDKTIPFPMKPGVYTIIGTAFLGGGAPVNSTADPSPANNFAAPTTPGTAAAWGSVSDAIVSTGTIDKELTLRASAVDVTTDSERTHRGTFSYSITNNTTAETSGTIAVAVYPGQTPAPGTPNTIPAGNLTIGDPTWAAANIPLTVGFYNLNFSFTRGTDTINHSYMLHIYEGMNSTFTFILTDDYFAITNVDVDLIIYYIHPTDALAPELSVVGIGAYTGTGIAGDAHSVALTGIGGVTFTVDNDGDYSSIIWTVNGPVPAVAGGDGATFKPAITAKGTYQITAIGIRAAPYPGPFSTVAWLVVE